MPLTGQAKIDYQREYMRKRRSNKKGVTVRPKSIRPKPTIHKHFTGELTKSRQTSRKGFNE